MTVKFSGGRNIAMKVPSHQYDAVVRFYRDVIGLEPIDRPEVGFKFGANNLWIDRVPHISQAELWLELTTDDTKAAADHLKKNDVVRCDDIEPLGESFDGFWISSPASIIHLVDGTKQSW